MDEQQSKDMNKENNGNTGNMTEENNPDKDFETNEDSRVNTEDSIDGTETKATQKNDKVGKNLFSIRLKLKIWPSRKSKNEIEWEQISSFL